LSRHIYRKHTYVMRSRTVTFLHGSNDTYGASRVLVEDARILKSLGWDVHVVLPVDGPLVSLLTSIGAQVTLHDLHVLRRVTISRTRVPLTLPGPASSADLVVLWTLALASYLPILTARRRPTICSAHEIQPGKAGTLLAWMVTQLAGGLMANSLATASWLRSCSRKGVEPVVAYPVAPTYEPLPLPASDQTFYVLMAGRVNGYKGHLESVLACRLARAMGIDIRLTLLGAPYSGQETHLDQLLDAINGDGWVTYLGEVPSIRPHLANAHVLLAPTTKSESFGIVALEGWAAGRLVLASDIDGLSEATDLVGGIKTPPSDVTAIAKTLIDVWQHKRFAQLTGESAQAARACTQAQRIAAWQELLKRTTTHSWSLHRDTQHESLPPSLPV
jgi:glycosyltransferase involved in cell wall biosynthesis